jgi:transposase
LPLEFEPGQDAQVDWGEAIAVIGGVRQTVQVFVMWLSYSRRRFVMCFPSQKQESFFYGHVCAFEHFGGVPWRISYDNLSMAVRLMAEGKVRREHRQFIARALLLPVREPLLPARGRLAERRSRGIGGVQSQKFSGAHP